MTCIATPRRGYQHARYAASLSEFGAPRYLAKSGGWVLVRQISGTQYNDAMGCYPLFACDDWSKLSLDFDVLRNECVALSLVADPFGCYHVSDLRRCFTDRFFPFKEHFVVDLRSPLRGSVSKHHSYYAKRALRSLVIDRSDTPAQFLDVWTELYQCLIIRHRLTGVRAFSRQAFADQLSVPGIVMLRAIHNGETVSAHLWYIHQEVVHSHLAASSERGYELMASYALYWYALETFASSARWLNLGAGSGRESDPLTRFKRGWATSTRSAFFCGRIFDRKKYNDVLLARQVAPSNYFPAYRRGEFP
jgi:hypothetical protein